uniref:Hypothetical secreted protein n=1 Tax=Simulium guianense TaxID=445764 RepID=F5GTT3_SIMGU
MSIGILVQTACLLLTLGTAMAKHYIDDPLATDCITKEVLWAVNYHHDISVSQRRLQEYDSMTCDHHKKTYETNYNELLKKGYKAMIERCVSKVKMHSINLDMEKCVDAKIKVQMARLNEVKKLIQGCQAPTVKIEMVEMQPKEGKNLTKPLSSRSSSVRRRSYF